MVIGKMNWRGCASFLLCLGLCGCSISRPTPYRPGRAEVDRIVRELEAMPQWDRFSADHQHLNERREIERAVGAIAAYHLNTIRAAIEYYLQACWAADYYCGAQHKVMILNNYLFDLPESVRRGSAHFDPLLRVGGGWRLIPDDPQWSPDKGPLDGVMICWPWSVDDQGMWRLTGTFSGYNGSEYPASEAFDYYREHFGRRKFPADQKTRE